MKYLLLLDEYPVGVKETPIQVPNIIYVGIIIAAVLCLTAVITIILVNKKKNNK